MRPILNRLVVVAFIAIIATPSVAALFGTDGGDEYAEGRTLAGFPAMPLRWADATAFLPGLDTWFADHFAFRSNLVRWQARTRYLWLGVSPTPMVGIGDRGWLAYIDDGGLEDFTNESLLTDSELQNWRDTVVRARDWSRAKGIAYLFTIAPSKALIYPEHFPRTARRVNRMSRTDQIFTAVSDLGVAVDVRNALMEEKTHVRLFQKTDTHWNSRGAYVAYRTIIDAARLQVPSIPPPKELSEFDQITVLAPGMDLAGMIGLKRDLGEEDLRLVPKQPRQYVVVEPKGNIVEAGEGRIVTEIPGSTLPRAVVFRDSFASAVAPFLSEHFSRVVYLWQYNFDADAVLAEHPDVVIQEIIGRHLYTFIPSPELIPDP